MKSQNQITARLDSLAKVQMELAKQAGVSAELSDLAIKTFDASLAKLENGLHKSVEAIRDSLPPAEEQEGNGSN